MSVLDPLPAASRPCPTLLAGRYRLGRLVGRGGMADVFAAHDEVLQRLVAVKVFRPETAAPHSELRRGNEVRLLSGLSHPGLVHVLDAGLDDENPLDPRPFVVLELVDGPTLAGEIARGPLPEALVRRIGVQLAGALAYVHGRGIVHRDVKPANILLGQGDDGVVAKLTDFGIAHLVDATRMTEVGLTSGTANYLSPEQVRNNVFSPSSDVYSLGLVLLECLTGRRAYPGVGVEAAVARLYTPPVIPESVDEQWRALLTAMTDVDPGRRPDAGQVAAWLAGSGSDALPTEVLALSPVPTPSAPRRRHRARAALITGLLAAVFAGSVAAWSAFSTTAPAGVATTPAPSSPAAVGHRSAAPHAPLRTSAVARPVAVTQPVTAAPAPAPRPAPHVDKPRGQHDTKPGRKHH